MKPFLSLLQFVLRREVVENTCDQCYESEVYPRNEDQNAGRKGQEPFVARLFGGQDSRSHGDFTISNKRKREITMCAGYIAVTCCYGLRGNEGMWVDADRLRRGIRVGEIPSRNEISHIIVSLLGRFKGEDVDRMHVFCLASTRGSGIQTRRIMERVANIHEEERTESCPAFCDVEGFSLMEKFAEEKFLHPILEELPSKGWDNDAIPEVKVSKDIVE